MAYLGLVFSQVVGVLVTLENAIKDGEQRGNLFWARLLQRQQQRLKGVYDRHIVRFLLLFFQAFLFILPITSG